MAECPVQGTETAPVTEEGPPTVTEETVVTEEDSVSEGEDTSTKRRGRNNQYTKQNKKKRKAILLRVKQWGLTQPSHTPIWKYFGKYWRDAPNKYSTVSVCKLCLKEQTYCEIRLGGINMQSSEGNSQKLL